MKTCTRCLRELPDSSFGPRRTQCRKCRTAATADWRRRNPERVRRYYAAYQRRRRATNPEDADRARARNAAYKRTNRARCSERERLRKAQIKSGHPQFVERVDRDVVHAMHGGRCGICGEFVGVTDFEIDHVVPLARGGLHGYVNTQPSHPTCNRKKYDHLQKELI